MQILAYIRERTGFKRALEGHRQSIMEDNIRTDIILKQILQNIEEYRAKFSEILTVREKFTLWRFTRLLKKGAKRVDFNDVCNYLSGLSGRPSKKEDTRHG